MPVCGSVFLLPSIGQEGQNEKRGDAVIQTVIASCHIFISISIFWSLKSPDANLSNASGSWASSCSSIFFSIILMRLRVSCSLKYSGSRTLII